jgi:hypothetical protein
MEEEVKTGVEGTTTENNTSGTETPTVEQLMAQIAAERAEKDRYKAANDKLSKSEAEMKKQLRAKLTAEEQAAEEQAEAQRLAEEERETMRKELNHIKAVAAYKEINEEKTVETLIEAIADGDHAAIAKIISDERKAAYNEAKAEFMKERGRINAGNEYSSMTKEQIMAIPDRNERRKAIALNPELFGKR